MSGPHEGKADVFMNLTFQSMGGRDRQKVNKQGYERNNFSAMIKEWLEGGGANLGKVSPWKEPFEWQKADLWTESSKKRNEEVWQP